MTSIDWKQTKAMNRQVIEIQKLAIEFDRIQTCTNCQHWNKQSQRCDEFKMLPPAEVIVTGCEEWIYIIPF